MTVSRGQLLRLAGAKAVSHTALRWLPFFLFVLEDAFDATTAQLTAVVGLGSMLGLSTVLFGRLLDRGYEQTLFVVALSLVSVSGLIALGGSLWTFVVSFLVLIVGVSLVTVCGHTWISRRVPYERRGRVLGVFEMSWGSALLIGAPIMALLIEVFGWRGPFVAVAISCAVAAVMIARIEAGPMRIAKADQPLTLGRLPGRAFAFVAMHGLLAAAGLSTFVIVGSWLEDTHGLSVGGVGVAAVAFGLAEIAASGSSARFADEIGKTRSTVAAFVVFFVGLAAISVSGTSLAVAIGGLALFFLGFEYAVVTALSLVSESAPESRGRVMAANSAAGTLGPGLGAALSGVIYTSVGIRGVVGLSIALGGISLLLLLVLTAGSRVQGQRV